MHMQVEIVDVAPKARIGKNGKPYEVVEVTYKDGGKPFGYKQMKFKNEELYNAIVELKKGDLVDVHKEKIGDYWDWTEVNLATTGTKTVVQDGPTTSDTFTQKTSAYMPDADRQKLIVRQSSIKAAIDFYAMQKKGEGASLGDVFGTAGKIESFVYGTLAGLPIDIDEDFIPA